MTSSERKLMKPANPESEGNRAPAGTDLKDVLEDAESQANNFFTAVRRTVEVAWGTRQGAGCYEKTSRAWCLVAVA